jgi:hypothetical protein
MATHEVIDSGRFSLSWMNWDDYMSAGSLLRKLMANRREFVAAESRDVVEHSTPVRKLIDQGTFPKTHFGVICADLYILKPQMQVAPEMETDCAVYAA